MLDSEKLQEALNRWTPESPKMIDSKKLQEALEDVQDFSESFVVVDGLAIYYSVRYSRTSDSLFFLVALDQEFDPDWISQLSYSTGGYCRSVFIDKLRYHLNLRVERWPRNQTLNREQIEGVVKKVEKIVTGVISALRADHALFLFLKEKNHI